MVCYRPHSLRYQTRLCQKICRRYRYGKVRDPELTLVIDLGQRSGEVIVPGGFHRSQSFGGSFPGGLFWADCPGGGSCLGGSFIGDN